MSKKQDRPSGHLLLRNMMRELYQTEKSAGLHPRREAERLGDIAPARALLAVSAHAEAKLAELPGLCERNKLPVSRAGQAIGAFFSNTREFVVDHLMDRERSYRGTLLGMRHGVDLVRVLKHAAEKSGCAELVSWCDRWLSERIPLVQQVEDELAWFSAHPEAAMEPAATFFKRQQAEAT